MTTTQPLPTTVIVAKGNDVAHFTTDGTTPQCGSKATLIRKVASAEAYVTCSKCRKAHGLVHMVGHDTGRTEFNTGRRVFGR